MIICYSRASYQGVTFYRAYTSYNLQDLATGKRLYDSTSLNCPICQAEIDKFCTKIEQAKDNLGNLLQRERESGNYVRVFCFFDFRHVFINNLDS
jgi:hypothetical protein